MAKVSLHNRRVSFAAVDDAPPQPRPTVAGVRFKAVFSGGRSAPIDLTSYPLPAIAAAAATILWEETQPGGSLRSPGSVSQITQSLARFADFLGACYARDPALTTLGAIVTDDVDAFDDYLHTRFGSASRMSWVRMQAFRQFLEIAHRHGHIGDHIKPRLAYVSRHGKGKSTPIDGYSPYVAAQLREASARDIERVVARITVDGEARTARGCNPDVNGWTNADNIVWHFANRGLVRAQHPLVSKVKVHTGFTCLELILQAHLDIDDVLAFTVLLSLSTGLPIECVRSLGADCLRNEGNGYADLCYVKRRAGRDTEMTKRVRCDAPMSPGWLVLVVQRLTQRSRQLADDDVRGWLFIGYNKGEIGRLIVWAAGPTKCSALRRFCERHAIVGDDGARLPYIILQRLRKTHKSERYRKVNGHLADFADDHTRSVAATNYADIPSMRPLHEATIEAGLTAAYDAAFAPVILDGVSEQRLQANPRQVADDVGKDATAMESVARGETDVWLAGCLGFDHSPHGAQGKPCPTPVWGCLECGNAVITASKLPALLAFLDHMLGKRQQMNLAAWTERFGRAYLRITEQILPRFPTHDIVVAKAIAESDTHLVWLPAELTMAP
ncbi:hypothetical protein HUE56_28105 (plasmid) [Azospirillum oryzae]|uniref:Core-binding (CB) domain-containing protein n=1 Tax=Azospirillum oryzae TaxID=286727 RepID=A0A6N1ASG3_9PROT|nr:hypothetical protein [Azospirillum oryzae]KAA0584841.1 hypothetical protein FZ938_27665 [Azospirillum oryzae]QKS54319.1 hypothetical protein HUE56_28105 [Azospirillum oryzae]GLR78892.1 hypothetical protein GCM10007856_15660 [Azospirillum oryzae]